MSYVKTKFSLPNYGRRILLCYVASVSLTCSALHSPVITDSYPTETTGFTSLRPQIFMTFDKAMNKEITQNAFSLTGDAPVPKGTFQWSGNTMSYVLEANLEYAGRYTVKLLPSAEGEDKSKYDTTFVAHFYAGTDLAATQVLATNPVNLNMNVALNSTIDITFSKPMSVTDTESAFQLSPSVAGLFSWSAGNTVLTYTPFQGLTFNQQYTVTVAKTAKDYRGMPLVSDYVFYFKAGANFVRPQVLTIDTTSGTNLYLPVVPAPPTTVEKNDGIVVTFDKAMDYSATQSAFSLIDAQFGNTIGGAFSWLASFMGFTFQPTDFLIPGREYYVRVTQSAKDTLGNPIQVQAYNSFTVNGPNSQYVSINQIQLEPACVASYVNSAGNTIFDITTSGLVNQVVFPIAPAWNCRVIITFSAPMSVQSIPDNISISRIIGNDTALVGAMTSLSWDATKTILTVGLGSLGDNVYLIKVIGTNSGILDQNSNYMRADFSMFFRSHQ